jgi:hypothetical protein
MCVCAAVLFSRELPLTSLIWTIFAGGVAVWSHRCGLKVIQWVEKRERIKKQSLKETNKIANKSNAMVLCKICFWPKFASKGPSNENAAPKAVSSPKFFPD